MGDRISIQFKNKKELSIVLFSHWDGIGLVKEAKKYVKLLKASFVNKTNPIDYPLTRLEPQTVMVDFIRYITKDLERVESNYYLGIDKYDGDNSDNGHHIINLEK